MGRKKNCLENFDDSPEPLLEEQNATALGGFFTS